MPAEDLDVQDVDPEAYQLRLAADSLQRACRALEELAVAATSRRALYGAWAQHLQGDWRSLALLAARGEGCGPDGRHARV
jgi:hypothetical protein